MCFPINKRRFSLVLGLLALLPLDKASAYLWETQAEVEARFGAPIKTRGYPHDRVFTYAFEGLEIDVTFFNGLSDEETYRHPDGNVEFTYPDIRRLLEMNSSGKPWRDAEEKNSWDVDTAKGRAYAFYSPDFDQKRLHLYTDGTAKRALEYDSAKYARTLREQTVQAIVTLKQEKNGTTLVAHAPDLVLEIWWNVERYPQKPSLVSGATYSITIRDEEYYDRDTVIAFVSDRDHKDLDDLIHDSKTFVVQRIENGDKVVFDRSICELHHVRMIQKMVPIEYGLRATPPDEAQCEKNFPHYRDFILGGCLSSPDSPGKAPIFVCPECVTACRRINY